MDRWVKIATIVGGVFSIVGGTFTVLGVILTVGTLFWGAYTYYQSAQAQADAVALETLREHWKLVNEHPELASAIPADKEKRTNPDGTFTPAYGRFAADALLTAENTYRLAGGEPWRLERWFMPEVVETRRAWNAAAIDLARTHDTFVQSYDFPCDQYEQSFIEFLKNESKRFENICPIKNTTDEAAIETLTNAAEAQQDFFKQNERYATDPEIERLSDHGFTQGNPPVEIGIVIDDENKRDRKNDAYYCMQAAGGNYAFFRITQYDDGPIPGSC